MNFSFLNPYTDPFLGRLNSRAVMSAMTRSFAQNHQATQEMAQYYLRRAESGAGLLLTEGIVIHPSGDGYPNVPRLHTLDQARSWVPLVRAVQSHGTKIFAQLWHCGKVSHTDFTDGLVPVSSTDDALQGICRLNQKPYSKPKALSISEIGEVLSQYENSCKLALDAGFDGVEIHAAHGYLIDQFLDGFTNTREDAYGGALENRARILLEITQRLLAICGPSKLVIRLSPIRQPDQIHYWKNWRELLQFLIPELASLGVRVLDISCARAPYDQTSGVAVRTIRPLWPHTIMGGASLTAEQAQLEISQGWLNLITWGRDFLSNPDLVLRMKNHWPIIPLNFEKHLSQLR